MEAVPAAAAAAAAVSIRSSYNFETASPFQWWTPSNTRCLGSCTAGRQQSMSPKYTEETVDTNVVMTSVTKNHRDPTTGSTLEPVVETVQEEPTRVPATTKILNTVTSLLGGGSSSDGSQVSAHMLPSPRKYYAKMGNTAPTVSSNSSGSL